MARFRFSPLQIVAHLGGWFPAAWLLFDFFTDGLTFNPIQYITLRTGKAALVLLLLSLACTPLNSLFGFRQAIKLRRPLGVYAGLYAVAHFLIFVGLDFGFDLELIYGGIFEKPFALVGFSALLLLLPLLLTSTKGWQKRLGKRWTRMHKLVYLAAPLVIVHYLWSVKSDIRQPLAYGAVLAALLVVRIPAAKRVVKRAAALLLDYTRPRPDLPPKAPKLPAPGQD